MARIEKAMNVLEAALEKLESSINMHKKNAVPIDHHKYITNELKKVKNENQELKNITSETSQEIDQIIIDLQSMLSSKQDNEGK